MQTIGSGDEPERRFSVLIIEASQADAETVRARLLADGRFTVRIVSTLAEAIEQLGGQRVPDAITLDLNLPDSSGMESFLRIHQKLPGGPIVILSDDHDEGLAVEAMREGAQDYVLKSSLDGAVLVRSLLYAIERNRRRLVEQQQRSVERELQLAKQIQQHLLPTVSPEIKGFDIAGRSVSSNSASGDFYDFIDHGDGKWDVVLADVCGHGIGPAMVTVGTRRLLRSCAALYEDLGDLITIANRGICEDTFESLFVTLFYARLDPERMRLDYVGAGHPAFVIDSEGVGRELSTQGLPTGLDPKADYEVDGFIQLDPGQIMLLASDGVWEAHDPDFNEFGKQRVFDVVHRHRREGAWEIADQLLAEVQSFCGTQPSRDDSTVVVIKRR